MGTFFLSKRRECPTVEDQSLDGDGRWENAGRETGWMSEVRIAPAISK